MHTTTLRMNDGTELAVSDWPLAGSGSTVLLVHGLGEHAGRYTHVAEWLNQQGYGVRAYDHYGHGHSSGPRGGLQRETQLLEHLAEVLAALRAERAPGHHITVLGHSLGGLVVAAAVARGLIAPDAMVLSSPALAVHMAAWQRAVVGWLPALWPNLTLGNGLQPQFLSHDTAVVQAYLDDPLVHDRICARLGAFVASTTMEGSNLAALCRAGPFGEPAWQPGVGRRSTCERGRLPLLRTAVPRDFQRNRLGARVRGARRLAAVAPSLASRTVITA